MKSLHKVLLGALLAGVALSAAALQEIPIASASRTATTTYSADLYAKKGDRAISINSYVTAIPSAATLTLTLQAKMPQGNYVDVLSSAATVASTSTFILLTAGENMPVTSNISANIPMPPVFRIKSVIGGSATYSIGVNRSN
jgi:hypothetical protein